MHENRAFVNQEDLNSKKSSISAVGGNISDFLNGPEEEEQHGLHVVERKRMRGGPGQFETMDTEGRLRSGDVIMRTINMEATLSGTDCVAFSKNDLATPAVQASQQQ